MKNENLAQRIGWHCLANIIAGNLWKFQRKNKPNELYLFGLAFYKNTIFDTL
jgi:hypothetical protein